MDHWFLKLDEQDNGEEWGVENGRHRGERPIAKERRGVKTRGITNVTELEGCKWNWITDMM